MKIKLKKFLNDAKKEKGITLIALVTTIVVLIILAAVTINFMFGENGIIGYAQKGKESTNKALEEEKQEMSNMEENMNELLEKIDKDEQTKVEGVIIPKGFYYVGGKKSEGIVISDNPKDSRKGTDHQTATELLGNQFVWVPVEYNTREEFDNNFNAFEGYCDNGVLDTMIGNCKQTYSTAEEKQYNEMRESVYVNKGFYVARYEASKENINTVDKATSKQGKDPWTNIPWGDNMSTIGNNGAVAKSEEMYDSNDFGVKSTLIYGVQWDAIMNWIDPKYRLQDKNNLCQSFVSNSTGMGNYNETSNSNEWKGKVTKTGSSANYKINNIYDLAGNCYEWTMESYRNTYRIFRGGYYKVNGYMEPASVRYGYGCNKSLDFLGFRIALYIKI